MVRQSGFFCFNVSKIERKDPGVLLFFCVEIPGPGAGQDQARLHPGAHCLDKGSVEWMDMCQSYHSTGCRSDDDEDEDPVP